MRLGDGQLIEGLFQTYYATYVFENSLGFDDGMSRLLAACNGTEYFLASLIAIPIIERVGRRKLMIFGAFGMMASMAILSGTSSTATINEFNAPVLDTSYGVVATIFLFGFNTFFAIGKTHHDPVVPCTHVLTILFKAGSA